MVWSYGYTFFHGRTKNRLWKPTPARARRRPWSSVYVLLTIAIAIALRRGPSLPVVSSTSAHDRIWQGMVRNFGYRWEGRTYWHDPDAAGDSAAEHTGLRSIYQLEFPQEGRAGVGTWKGWNVLEAGDTRTVPLSRETCINRTKGSSTFQFAQAGVGVGGRCPVSFSSDDDAPQQLMMEINFFHGNLRRGLVVTYTLEEEREQNRWYYQRKSRILVMNFRRASKGYREDNHMEPENRALTARSETAVERAATGTRAASEMATGTNLFSSLTLQRSFSLSRNDYVERDTTRTVTKDSIVNMEQQEKDYVFTPCPEGFFSCLPDVIPLGEEAETFELQFGCDFRGDGGPVKVLCIQYDRDKQLAGWELHEFVD